MGVTCARCAYELYNDGKFSYCPNHVCSNYKLVTRKKCPSCHELVIIGLDHICPAVKPGTVTPVKDAINPDHYKSGGIETIDYMQAKLSPEGFEGYLVGNVLKYVSRYNKKNGIEDLKKSEWYLARLIEFKGSLPSEN